MKRIHPSSEHPDAAVQDDFSLLLQTLDSTHRMLQHQAARSVDTALVVRNWLFGWYIVEFEQGAASRSVLYGKQLIQRLSSALEQRGIKGTSATSLKQCRTFYLAYAEIGQTLPDQSLDSLTVVQKKSSLAPTAIQRLTSVFKLGWSHYVQLLALKSIDERRFYEIEAHASSWSGRELKRQVAASLYERLALSRDKEQIKALAQNGQIIARPSDVLKSPYVLEFLDLPEQHSYSEHELESAIISRLETFLLELGKGFLFEARQKRFSFDDDHFYVDLVFYNRLLKCYVLIDLKRGRLTHQDLGQMQMYVNYFDRYVKRDDENATIGIILCKQKADALVEITLPKDANIHASEYQLYLPSKQELQQRLNEWAGDVDA